MMQARRNPFIPKACRSCGFRLSRARLKGHCIRCARIRGILPASKYTPVEPPQIPADRLAPRPPLERVYEGKRFEIMWNGS